MKQKFKCPVCEEFKLADEFYKSNTRKSGRSCYCRECSRIKNNKKKKNLEFSEDEFYENARRSNRKNPIDRDILLGFIRKLWDANN